MKDCQLDIVKKMSVEDFITGKPLKSSQCRSCIYNGIFPCNHDTRIFPPYVDNVPRTCTNYISQREKLEQVRIENKEW